MNIYAKPKMLLFDAENTAGLLGTWNDNRDDDYTAKDGQVLPSSSSLSDIHYGFGQTCEDICIIKICFITPQPLATRGIVMINTGGRAEGRAACGRRIKLFPLHCSVPSIESDLKLTLYVDAVL